MLNLLHGRMGWIEAFVRYSGRFGPEEKSEYGYIFGLSSAQVARDQDVFISLVNKDVPFVTKKGGKLYMIEPTRHPEGILAMPSHQDWISSILKESFHQVRKIERVEPARQVVNCFVKAIRGRTSVKATYHSRSGRGERTLSPHSIVEAAGRLHARAYDHEKMRFGDFVLSRVSHCQLDPKTGYIPHRGNAITRDEEWITEIGIEIVATSLPPSEAVRMEFGLGADGRKVSQIKAALAGYLVEVYEPGFEPPVTIRRMKTLSQS